MAPENPYIIFGRNGAVPGGYEALADQTPVDDIRDMLSNFPLDSAAIPDPIIDKKIWLPDGIVTEPSLSWSQDTNTGAYRIGTDNVGFSAGGGLIFQYNATYVKIESGKLLRLGGFSAGSVLFTDSDGDVTEDNASLYWDDASNTLSIGSIREATTKNGILKLFGSASYVTFREPTGDHEGFCGLSPYALGTFALGCTSLDTVKIYTNNAERIAIGSGGGFTHTGVSGAHVVWNNTSLDLDYYIYSDTELIFFVDGGNSRIGINSPGTTPRRTLDITDALEAQLRLTFTDNTKYVEFLADTNSMLTWTSPSGTMATLSALGNAVFTGTGQFTRLGLGAAAHATACLLVNDLTATRIPYVGASNELVDSANLTFSGTNLLITGTEQVTRLGIGMAADASRSLAIAESMIIPDTVSATTGVIYKGASHFIHDFRLAGTNGQNTFVGIASGNFTMTGSAGIQGSTNSALGYGTLTALTTGFNNTSIGSSAMFFTTTGYSNVALGTQALYSQNTGAANSAFGVFALSDVTDGLANIGFGYYTGLGITTGDYNTIIGAQVTGLAANLQSTVIIADGRGLGAAGSYRMYSTTTGTGFGGTTHPDRALDVLDASGNPQQRWTYTDGTIYGEVQVTSGGNIYVSGTGTYFSHQRSASGAYLQMACSNTSNTAGSHAYVRADVGGTSAGDPVFLVNVTGGSNYYFGIDNSDNDYLDIGSGIAPGGNIAMRFGPAVGVIFNENHIGAYDFRVRGDTLAYMLFCDATDTTENIALLTGSAPGWNTMDIGLFIGENATAPTGNPAAGFYAYGADWNGAGTCVPFFRGEDGGIVKLFKGATIADPSGGVVQDAEARTAINALIDRLQGCGLIA